MRVSLPLGVFPATVEISGFALSLGERATVASRSGEILALDFAASRSIEAWTGRSWLYLLGSESSSIYGLAVQGDEEDIRHMGDLSRLDMSDGYDSGGLHSLQFFEMDFDDVVVAHEFGLARLQTGDLLWENSHSDITSRVLWSNSSQLALACDEGARVNIYDLISGSLIESSGTG